MSRLTVIERPSRIELLALRLEKALSPKTIKKFTINFGPLFFAFVDWLVAGVISPQGLTQDHRLLCVSAASTRFAAVFKHAVPQHAAAGCRPAGRR
jgi:hypothetical protein